MEGIALIGYSLHFTKSDIENMRLSEFFSYVDLAKKYTYIPRI